MFRKSITAALLCGSAFAISGTAYAQDPAPQAEPTEPDASDTTADAAIAEAQPVDELQSKIELLQAQVEALQDALEGVKAAQVKTTPSWKGGPLFEDKEAGWSFKPRGRLQFDVGFVGNPEDDIVTRNLGFNARARRVRLGFEGTIPGGFGYKAEADFANSSVGFGDVIITYAPSGKPFNFSIGNHESLDGLEQMSSSRFSSFVERAAFDDAFVNTRRIGLSGGYANKAGTFRFNAGLFAAHSIDASLDNDGWIGAARATYSPLMGANQLHFGVNFQHREFQENNCTPVSGACAAAQGTAGAPSAANVARYRARPYSQLTDVRFVDTGAFAAKGDDIIGFEAAGIFKSLHIAAEGQWTKVNVGYAPGDILTGVDQFVNNSSGVPGYVVPTGDPSFFGGYVEAGYFFTGETRGYKGGLWDRTKVLKPFSKGGWGALQLNGRVDYLNLNDNKIQNGLTNNFASGATSLSSLNSRLGRGGEQLGLLTGLTWIPEDYMRVLLNYSHAQITGGPFAATVKSGSSKPVDEREFGVDVLQARFQVDF